MLPPAPPLVSSPTITLTNPNPDEQTETWTATRSSWGANLSLAEYLEREAYMLTIPLARDGGLTPWILTDTGKPSMKRPVLSSCETIRKRALVRGPDGVVRDVFAHGVASVFTYERFRRQGYANKMMNLLGQHLDSQQQAKEGDAQMSILFSDIGKDFYAREGWIAIGNTQIDITVKSPPSTTASASVKPILDSDLAALTADDEAILRRELAKPSPDSTKDTRVAIAPDHTTFLWQFHREDFICKYIFSSTPTVRGAIYTPPSNPHQRVWALWARNLYGGKTEPEKNRFNILRFVIEDESISDELLLEGIKGILAVAQEQSNEWLCSKMDLWSPSSRTRRLIEGIPDLESEFVTRETGNLASLRWVGQGTTDNIEWLANQRFAWC